MTDDSLTDLIRVTETWVFQREEMFKRQAFNGGANAASLREFAEIQNRLTRRLMRIVDREKPEFWSGLLELAMNAQRMGEGGRVFVDKQDRSSEGM